MADAAPELNWLARFAGDWTYEARGKEPGKDEPWVMRGTESVRIVGTWIVCEGTSEMLVDPDHLSAPGQQHTNITALGFDPNKGKISGTFISSAMPDLWLYDGELDLAEDRLTLATEGPRMDGTEGTARYEDIHELLPDGRRVLRSRAETAPGEWMDFMRQEYTRA